MKCRYKIVETSQGSKGIYSGVESRSVRWNGGALYTENDGENKPLASGESTSIRFIRESHCNRTSMSGSEAEASSESRRGLISAMSLGFVDAAEETRRRA
jgi:hypothetical protein